MLQGPLIGLELLLDTTRIRLRQRIQMVKIYCGCDMPMNFELINERNQIIYQSEEHNGCCIRNCVPQGMRTESILSTMINAPVLRFQRESRCVLNCCLPCCCCALPFSKEQLSVVSIAGGGSVLGTIRHDWSMWTSKFSVLNGTGEVMAKIEGPGKGNFSCGGDIEFQMLAPNGYKLGSITKHYGGLVGELCTDFDEFTINFPLDLDVTLKACLVGAAHLIVSYDFLDAFPYNNTNFPIAEFPLFRGRFPPTFPSCWSWCLYGLRGSNHSTSLNCSLCERITNHFNYTKMFLLPKPTKTTLNLLLSVCTSNEK